MMTPEEQKRQDEASRRLREDLAGSGFQKLPFEEAKQKAKKQRLKSEEKKAKT
jgi:hypothetical protein